MVVRKKVQPNKIYLYFLVFLLVYMEFGYAMVVGQVFSGKLRTAIILLATLPLLACLNKNDFIIFFKSISNFLGIRRLKGGVINSNLWQKGRNTDNAKALGLFIYFTCIIALNALRDFDFKDNILLIVPIYIGFIIALTVDFKDLVCVFVDIMSFLALFSLMVFAIRVLEPEMIDRFPMLGYVNGSRAEAHDCFFAVSITHSTYIRNYGITWEPGAFALLLCLAIFCILSFEDEMRPFEIVVMLSAILTTFSTMGYFVVCGIVFSSLFQRKKKQAQFNFFLICMGIAFVVLFLFLPQKIKDLVFKKLAGLLSSKDTQISVTTQARINAIIYPFLAFLRSPILGVGYENFSYLNRVFCDSVATNTIMNWFALLGILLGGPCLYYYLNAWLKVSRHLKLNIFAIGILIISVILLVSTESLLRISLIYVIVFYGTKETTLESFEEKDSKTSDFFIPKSKTKKVLFILGAYYPRYSANGLCSKNVIEELSEKGYSVTVLANDSKELKLIKNEEEIPNFVRVKPRLFIRLKEWSEMHGKSKPRCSRLVLSFAKFLNKIKLLMMAPFWPKVSFFANYRFKETALNLQQQIGFDAVISVYTPIEALLAGYAVKKRYPEVLFFPYFLDSLSGGCGPKYFSKKTIIKRNLKVERKVFKRADKVVLMESSKAHQTNYNREFLEKLCFLDIPMLKDVKSFNKKGKRSQNVIKLLFVGSISKNVRSPKTLVDTLMQLNRTDIKCEFVGQIDCLEMFVNLKKKMGRRLIFSDFIKHDGLKNKLNEATILINIGNNIETMVPSKIFEYMSYGKPIISTFDIENEPSKKYLEKYPLALLLSKNNGAKENAKSLSKFIDLNRGKLVEFSEVKEKFKFNTPQAFEEMITKHVIEERVR